MKTESPFLCPLCMDTDVRPVSRTCDRCLGWWVDPGRSRYQRREVTGPPARGPLALRLDEREPCAFDAVVAVMGLLCLGATGLGMLAVYEHPTALFSWAQLLMGLLLAYVGFRCLLAVLASILRARSPARLDGDDDMLRLSLWDTWGGEGLWAPVRRIELRVPRADLRGVALSEGQGGPPDTQLFLLHRSGLALGTGWSGEAEEAQALGERVVGWLEGRAPQGDPDSSAGPALTRR